MNLRIDGRLVARAVLFLAFLRGWSLPLRADSIVFSNISGSFCNCGFEITRMGLSTPSVAAQFTPSGNFSFTDAMVGITTNFFGGSLNVYLESNSGGLPGSVIEQVGSSIAVSAMAQVYITANSFSKPITLLSGVPYWLVVAPATADTSVIWDADGTTSVPFALNTNGGSGGPWSSLGTARSQFEIDGTPTATAAVPEPSSLLLLGAGLSAFGVMRRRLART